MTDQTEETIDPDDELAIQRTTVWVYQLIHRRVTEHLSAKGESMSAFLRKQQIAYARKHKLLAAEVLRRIVKNHNGG